jgi:sensor domain CHASE-containing protein
MKLNAKVILLLCGLFGTYGIVNYAVQRATVLPSFVSLEEQLARTDMERVVRALDGELAQLLTFCADWGNWLETYRFLAGEQPSFIEDNMTPATIEAAGLDLVAYLDRDGRLAWQAGFDPDTREPIAFEMTAGETLASDHPFRAAIAAGEPAKGLALTEHGPAMLVVAPVLDGAGNGPHRGAVLLARLITPAVAERLAEQAQVRLQVTPIASTGTSALAGAATAVGPQAPVARVARDETVTRVYRDLTDIRGVAAVQFRVELPRSVSAQGLDAIGYATLSLLGAGLVAMAVLFVAMRVLVLRPVSRMTRHAVAISEGDDLTRRMDIRRDDELGILAREFDRMVDKLADTRRRLVDQSFEAGAAEVASGVLHNVGNAMTPLAVAAANLQRRLSEAPAGEVAMVLGELQRGVADPARHADLEQLLGLTARELVAIVGRAGRDAETVTRHAEMIQAILAQQVRSAARGPVIETVRLDALVTQGLEAVPSALLRRLEVELDESLLRLGALPVPRLLLQQVLQNLLLNAAESVRDGGRDRGRVRIEARLEPGAGRGTLVLRVSDDGRGIAAADLERVFEKGYTTKSRETNQGIGLHWCANAVNAVGGCMQASSEGPGRGATLELALPLSATEAATVPRAA